jgi:vacuolar-type H+-ATPase subunit E/Vma4
MGYAELGRALEEEARRQVAEIDAESERAAVDLVAAARREAAAEREAALAADARTAAAEARRLEARLHLELERALLVEARAVLAEIEAEAASRLDALSDPALSARLVAELRPEMDGPGWTITGEVATRGGRTLDNSLRARLRRAMPDLEPELARLLFEGEA